CQAKYFGLAGRAERARRSQQANPLRPGARRAGAGRGPEAPGDTAAPVRPPRRSLGAQPPSRPAGSRTFLPGESAPLSWAGSPGLLAAPAPGPARPCSSPSQLQKPGVGTRQAWDDGSAQPVPGGRMPACDPSLLGIRPGHTRG
ncbi:homeobox protein CDX-1-like, partial [Herpailurus yagouaroundi]|uniref:homeobox protein CDX-1-like n=1 Tax=Herpailurus yagouaroundi TaxID=1608482 RepID=UPI001AD681A7